MTEDTGNRKELRKSLKHWKREVKELDIVLANPASLTEFMVERLTHRRDEALTIVSTLERQLDLEEKSTEDS